MSASTKQSYKKIGTLIIFISVIMAFYCRSAVSSPQKQVKTRSESLLKDIERYAGDRNIDTLLEDELSFGQILKRDIKDLPRSLWEDTKRVYLNRDNLLVLLATTAATIAVRNTVDDQWEDHFDKHRSFKKEWGDTASILGNPGLHFAVAAAGYYYAINANDQKAYSASKALINALIINGLSTMLLKISANTESPNGENLAWPSGHTSSSFCFAAVMDTYYGHKVGIGLYLLAGFIGFERMDDGEHHFSDVLFGAVLGYIVGKSVSEGHIPELLGGKIIPYGNSHEGGVVWIKDF